MLLILSMTEKEANIHIQCVLGVFFFILIIYIRPLLHMCVWVQKTNSQIDKIVLHINIIKTDPY